MLTNLFKTPFPWFGGKGDAAPAVWEALGDVPHYVEPFAGSLAVLLRRPHECNRPYFSETVNDLDGLLVNAWRSIQHSPDAVPDVREKRPNKTGQRPDSDRTATGHLVRARSSSGDR